MTALELVQQARERLAVASSSPSWLRRAEQMQKADALLAQAEQALRAQGENPTLVSNNCGGQSGQRPVGGAGPFA